MGGALDLLQTNHLWPCLPAGPQVTDHGRLLLQAQTRYLLLSYCLLSPSSLSSSSITHPPFCTLPASKVGQARQEPQNVNVLR